MSDERTAFALPVANVIGTRQCGGCSQSMEVAVLWTIAVVLVVLWVLGLVTSYTIGGLIHVLLALAIIAVLIRLIQGRRIV